MVSNDEGFIEANKKKGKGKQQGTNRQIEGLRFHKPKVSYYYRPVLRILEEQNLLMMRPRLQILMQVHQRLMLVLLLVTTQLLVLLVV